MPVNALMRFLWCANGKRQMTNDDGFDLDASRIWMNVKKDT